MKPKSIYTKKLAESLAAMATERKKNKYHIITGLGNWRVVPDGKLRARRIFKSEEEAIQFAIEIAKKHQGEVVVHTYQGYVKERFSFSA
ncbi:MAG: DUF2188 domain-containing protein [Chitinophagaceae bacterium]|nr:DUF2188 domain-containing protein [Chitinophagaceae bacterium]